MVSVAVAQSPSEANLPPEPKPSIAGEVPPFNDSPDGAECYDEGWTVEGGNGYCHEPWYCSWLGTRHSSTHGRSIGVGQPLRGTSWLNRPYGVAFEFGALVMVGGPGSGVDPANDLFAAIQTGWDWDHYWGGQLRVGWSTPHLNDGSEATDRRGRNLFMGDVSVLYYPWGDSRIRPYTRLGVGLTDLEYTTPLNVTHQENLFTIPLAVGVKYQFRRWAVWRAEFANNLAIAQNNANTFDNITLTLGVEGRFGGRPSGYWAWHPRGHAW